MTSATIAGLDRKRLARLAMREAKRFAMTRPKSRDAMAAGAGNYLDEVPLHWMKDCRCRICR